MHSSCPWWVMHRATHRNHHGLMFVGCSSMMGSGGRSQCNRGRCLLLLLLLVLHLLFCPCGRTQWAQQGSSIVLIGATTSLLLLLSHGRRHIHGGRRISSSITFERSLLFLEQQHVIRRGDFTFGTRQPLPRRLATVFPPGLQRSHGRFEGRCLSPLPLSCSMVR